MNGRPHGLSGTDAALLAKGLALLQGGRAREAATIAGDVARRAPGSADAFHLLALAHKALGENVPAAVAFDKARTLAPRDPNVLGNYANLLCRMQRYAEAVALYREALALVPTHGENWINLGLALLDAGDASAACTALEQAVAHRPAHSPAWQALGAARRAAGDLGGAEEALRKAVSVDPRNGAAWVNLGVVRRLLGDPEDSLECYAKARAAGFSAPEVADAEASAWLDLGEPRRALEGARRLTAAAPAYAPGHAMLARILWEHPDALAPGEDVCSVFRAAVADQPQNAALRMEFVRFLIEAGFAEEALTQVRMLRSTADGPVAIAMEAQALEALGRASEARILFEQAYPAARMHAGFLNLYVRHLLKARDPGAASRCALEALDRDPHNQMALAYLGVAWRLLDDAREEWLCGYDRLIGEVAVDPPPGFRDEADFLEALERKLVSMHTAQREPVEQSVRGGTQTSGVLFGRRDPLIRALRDAISHAVSHYVDHLPDDDAHPYLRRKSRHVRFTGSWSVRLRAAGRHINHIHQEGWMSSAFYISLPPSVRNGPMERNDGCIQFGEPPTELELGLGPRRIIRPTPGRLVLFPSYIWHGTLPFEDAEPRLTVAFDAAPMRTVPTGSVHGPG